MFKASIRSLFFIFIGYKNDSVHNYTCKSVNIPLEKNRYIFELQLISNKKYIKAQLKKKLKTFFKTGEIFDINRKQFKLISYSLYDS